jgi:hypothetical protein
MVWAKDLDEVAVASGEKEGSLSVGRHPDEDELL